MIFRLLIVAYAAGVLIGSLALISSGWSTRLVRLWLAGQLIWLESVADADRPADHALIVF